MIPAVGGRGDLAKAISAEKLGDRPTVFVDPETIMPMPRAFRQQILDDNLDKGRISLPTYQKRSPFADVRDMETGDTDQWQRAMWINTLIEEKWEELAQLAPEERYAPDKMPILWQDVSQMPPAPQQAAVGPASTVPAMYRTVHKTALLDIILDERKPWPMRQIAVERYGVYDQLERAMNDPTGQTMIPTFVLGVPPDKIMQQIPPPPLPGLATGTPVQTPVQQEPSNPELATSAAPTNAPVLSAASKQTLKPLGGFGEAEAGIQQA